jgi:hypothetical protein
MFDLCLAMLDASLFRSPYSTATNLQALVRDDSLKNLGKSAYYSLTRFIPVCHNPNTTQKQPPNPSHNVPPHHRNAHISGAQTKVNATLQIHSTTGNTTFQTGFSTHHNPSPIASPTAT